MCGHAPVEDISQPRVPVDARPIDTKKRGREKLPDPAWNLLAKVDETRAQAAAASPLPGASSWAHLVPPGMVQYIPERKSFVHELLPLGPETHAKLRSLEIEQHVVSSRGKEIVGLRYVNENPRQPGQWRPKVPTPRWVSRQLFPQVSEEQSNSRVFRRFVHGLMVQSLPPGQEHRQRIEAVLDRMHQDLQQAARVRGKNKYHGDDHYRELHKMRSHLRVARTWVDPDFGAREKARKQQRYRIRKMAKAARQQQSSEAASGKGKVQVPDEEALERRRAGCRQYYHEKLATDPEFRQRRQQSVQAFRQRRREAKWQREGECMSQQAAEPTATLPSGGAAILGRST